MENKDGMQRGTEQKSTVPVFSSAPELLLDTVTGPCNSAQSLRNGPEHSDVHDHKLNPPKAKLPTQRNLFTPNALKSVHQGTPVFLNPFTQTYTYIGEKKASESKILQRSTMFHSLQLWLNCDLFYLLCKSQSLTQSGEKHVNIQQLPGSPYLQKSLGQEFFWQFLVHTELRTTVFIFYTSKGSVPLLLQNCNT